MGVRETFREVAKHIRALYPRDRLDNTTDAMCTLTLRMRKLGHKGDCKLMYCPEEPGEDEMSIEIPSSRRIRIVYESHEGKAA